MDEPGGAGVLYQDLQVHYTAWAPAGLPAPALNIRLDGCIVPDARGEARLDAAHLVVLDGFLDEPVRRGLMDALLGPGWPGGPAPPDDQWERATADAAGMAPTWGLKDGALHAFAASACWAKLEVQSRLCKLYPEARIVHLPSDSIQAPRGPCLGRCREGAAAADAAGGRQAAASSEPQPAGQHPEHVQQQAAASGAPPDAGEAPPEAGEAPAVDCNQFVANAAVAGDAFSWHVDADPWAFPPSPWTQQHGTYFNREPGKPLLVSLLVYLDEAWERGWDAETLFLDTGSDTGVLVRPKRLRAVLMDQDVLHRVSAPSASAGRPRFSLVWKLVFLPRRPGQACTIARPEWGPPSPFGSAARMQAAVAASGVAAAARKRQREAAGEQQAAAGAAAPGNGHAAAGL